MSEPLVSVNQGILRGLTSVTRNGTKYFSFLGIPYALPPIGDLRFKNSLPGNKWNDVLDATKERNIPPQLDPETNECVGDEDCLFLNIFSPKLPAEKDPLLPVIIYIPGGGFVSGSGDQKNFGPDYIVESDCIMVSMNYRLGVLGFLCLETQLAPGNMGLQDQHLAIQWVHDNIEVFGGDPNNITLFGISAGAASVESHILSPKSYPGFFHKAIMHSGSTLSSWFADRKYLSYASRLAKKLGKDTKDPNEIYNLFKNTPYRKLIEETSEIITDDDIKNGSYSAFTPVFCTLRDTISFLDRNPIDILKSGNFLKIPTISGFCEMEGIFFQRYYKNIEDLLDNRIFTELIPNSFNIDIEDYTKRLKYVYRNVETDKNDDDFKNNFLTDLAFLGPITKSLEYKVTYDAKQYLFCFTHDGKLNFSKNLHGIKDNGACHADELTYLGTNEDVTYELAHPLDVIVKKRMVRMWTDFAKTGNPTPSIDVDINVIWKPVTETSWNHLNIGSDLVMETGFEKSIEERRKLWSELHNFLQ